MRERSSSSPAFDRPIVVQPSVAANGACWRRQAMSVVSGTPTYPAAANAHGDGPTTGTKPCGDGRSTHQDKN